MERKKLLAKLQDLRITALETHRLNETGRKHLYKTLACTYFVHRQFMQADPQYLNQLYDKAGIVTTGGQSNEVNYRPFLRLVWDQKVVSGYLNNKLTQWSAVLRLLDARYLENPAYFDEMDGEDRMASYIDECGGINAMLLGNKTGGEDTPEVARHKPSEVRKIVEKQQATEAVAERRLEMLANTSAPALASVTPAETVRSDENKLVALIGRMEADGSIKLLGSTNETDAIKAVAAHALRKDYRLVSPALRQIGEIIATQMFPQVAKPRGVAQLKAWRDRIYYDQGKGKRDEPMTSARRLMLRGKQGDLLFSCMRRERSVVVICKPTSKLAPKGKSIYLQTVVRGYIEDAMASGSFEMMRSTPADKLLTVTGKAHTHMLTTHDAVLGKSRAIHFYEVGRKQDNAENNWQATFRADLFKPSWSMAVDADWLIKLRAEHLDEWFITLGRNTQLKRENNFFFGVSVTTNQFSLRYNIDATGDAPVHTMPAKPKMLAGGKTHECKIRSKDIAPVLYNLADMPLMGKAEISGNADALVIKFKTAMGEYLIAVPTLRKPTANDTPLFVKEQ